MPIKHAIWAVGNPPKALARSQLAEEKRLEDMIVACPELISDNWMIIGRQERTGSGGIIDLLAITPDGSLVLIELKRNRTPRDTVAQALDYAAWVQSLSAERIAQMFSRFSSGKSLAKEFKQKFGQELEEDALNQSHQIIIVAAEFDDATERIIDYLSDRDIAINVIFFQVFEFNGQQLLSRAWLIDPGETQANVAATEQTKGPKEPWNGEFYVSFGDVSRSWSDAVRFGFISAGGGSWYTQTLDLLSPGDRIWVNIPQKGYVGVGIVRSEPQKMTEFKVRTAEGELPALEVLHFRDVYKQYLNEPELHETFIAVEWLDTVPVEEAVSEVGLFGNQNTVCRPTTPKWRHTVERLKTQFPKWNQRVSAPNGPA